MAKARTRGLITLDDGTEVGFTSVLPPWLARLAFKAGLVIPTHADEQGNKHVILPERVTNVIITHTSLRKR